MKLLVTGGYGFISSNFVHYMLRKYPNYQIINFDKLTYAGNPVNLKDLGNNPNYSFVEGDICDPITVNEVMKKVDQIVHFAAESHVDRSIEDGSVFVSTNALGTNTFLQSALADNIKKFIHISTDEVYGSIKKGFFTEKDNLNPSSPYSSSKAGSDLLTISYYTTYDLPVCITRCTNDFGSYQYPEKLIPFFISGLMEGKKVPIYDTGLDIRDWIYVDDHCSAIDFVLYNGNGGEIYNTDGGNELTNLEITHRLLKMLGKDKSSIEYVEDRKGLISDILLTAVNWKRWVGSLNTILILHLSKQSNGILKTDGGGTIKTLIIGASGMLGSDLCKAFSEAIKLTHKELDITNRYQVLEFIQKTKPEIVVNAVAYTDVEGCEDQRELAFQANGCGLGYIAEACSVVGANLVHFSTDYFFDGSKKEYVESDFPNPTNAYGYSKLLGENKIIENLDDYRIIRTSWLFGIHGRNFVETMLRLSREMDTEKVVNDQFDKPTYTMDLASRVKEIIELESGIYHIINEGICSWYKFASAIIDNAVPCTSGNFQERQNVPHIQFS